MDKVRIGFIGAGVHANAVHYPSLAQMDDVEIVAVCDINEERLKKTAEKYGIPGRYKDYRKMLREEKLDAVYVIMPPHLLHDIVVDVLKNGLNIFIEKPPGITRFQTESWAKLAEEKEVKTMVGFNRRFIPLVRVVRDKVLEYGPITQCVSIFYKNMVGVDSYYNGAIDILTCDAIHAVDMLRWMCGEPVKVVSVAKSFYSNRPNSFYALVEFESSIGVLLVNWSSGSRIHVFELHSKGVYAYINPDDKAVIYASDKAYENKEWIWPDTKSKC